MKIGEVARRAGVSVDAVRYYERNGLLHEAARTASGYRVFPPEAVERIRFIKQVQALGFALDDVADVLHGIDRGSVSYRRIANRLEQMLEVVDERLADMRALRKQVGDMRDAFRSGHCDDMESTMARLRGPRGRKR